ncbi:MAG: TRC40/GET3/ArsA family transport-energizing ATPase [Crenarchaeota archaeon]|nr:TRC40/GET3/ArsA family transport-energizing ATPase [Thermoproteota archaeon]
MAVYVFAGKGGVGKTTSSAAFAVLLAERLGRRVLVASIDPAHNLGDVLGVELGGEPRRVWRNLYAAEVDYEAVVERYMSGLTEKLSYLYRHLKAFNLEGTLRVMRYAPGVEENAVLEELLRMLRSGGGFDDIVIDPPPTGMLLRILSLPLSALQWVRGLMRLRMEILKRRRMIVNATGEEIRVRLGGEEYVLPSSPGDDPVYRELAGLEETYREAIERLVKGSTIILVINPETLPLLEAERTYRFLKSIGARVGGVVVNKYREEGRRVLEEARSFFKEEPFATIPLLPREPRGIDRLREVAARLEALLP